MFGINNPSNMHYPMFDIEGGGGGGAQAPVSGQPAPAQTISAPNPAPSSSATPASAMSIEDRVFAIFNKAEAQTGTDNISSQPAAPAQQPGQAAAPAAQQQQAPVQPDTAQQPSAQQPGQAQVPQQDNLIAGKFKSMDDFVAGYNNLQADYTRKAQDLSALKTANEKLAARVQELEQKIQNPQAQQPQPAAQQQPETIDPEEDLSQFYANPRQYIADQAQKIADRIVQERLTPLQQRIEPVITQTEIQTLQTNWNGVVENFVKEHPDALQFSNEISMYFQQHPELEKNPSPQTFNDAYIYARGLRYQPVQPQPPPDLAKIAADPEFQKNYIFSNSDLINSILQNHMQQVKEGNASVPPVISGAPGQQFPATPPNKARNMQEAGQRLDAMFGLVKQ